MWNEARIINATANLLMVLAVLALLGAALVWLVRLPAFDFKKSKLCKHPTHRFSTWRPI